VKRPFKGKDSGERGNADGFDHCQLMQASKRKVKGGKVPGDPGEWFVAQGGRLPLERIVRRGKGGLTFQGQGAYGRGHFSS